MANGFGPPDLDKELAVPWQIKILYWFGIPTLITLYLVWYGTSRLDKTMQEMQNSLVECTKLSSTMSEELSDQHQQMDVLRNDMISTLVKICVNTAPNPSARNACFKEY